MSEQVPATIPAGPDLSHIHAGLRHLAVSLAELTHDPANARLHDEVNLQSIMNSLKAFGQDQPLVVQKQGMIVRKGNGRMEAALRLGYTHMAALIVDEGNVTAIARAIADNRTAELARWDMPTLSKLMAGLASEGVKSATVGFSAEEAQQMFALAAPPVAELTDNVDEDEPAEKITTTVPTPAEPEPDASEGVKPLNAVISYTLIFDAVEQQESWFQWIRSLKAKYPECETIGARVAKFLTALPAPSAVPQISQTEKPSSDPPQELPGNGRVDGGDPPSQPSV